MTGKEILVKLETYLKEDRMLDKHVNIVLMMEYLKLLEMAGAEELYKELMKVE